MKILILIPYMFLPPNSGNKNLLYNLLKFITNKVDCDLVILLDDLNDKESFIAKIKHEFPKIKSIIIFSKPSGISLYFKMTQYLLRGFHPSLGRYYNKSMIRWLSKNAVLDKYDLIHFDMIHMSQYKKYCKDIPSLLIASDAYSMAARKAGILSSKIKTKLRMIIESFLLKNIEKNIYPNFTQVCSVSEIDIKYLKSIDSRINLKKIGIGVDQIFLNKKRSTISNKNGIKILCTGNLNHEIISANIIDFLKKDLPLIRNIQPDIQVIVLGNNPTKKLKLIMNNTLNLRHIEYVENYSDFLSQDWIYVYPQKCGTGLQTKLQQAMAAGLPVVGYEVSFGGLSVKHGEHCFICKNSDDFVKNISKLIFDDKIRNKISSNAAKHIRKNFSIDIIGSEMIGLYTELIKNSNK